MNVELREMTNSHLTRERPVMISATIPSAKYSCSWPPLRSLNGSTAIDDRRARGVDSAVQGRFRDDPAAPQRVQQVVLGDDAVAVADQKHQQVKYLWLQRDSLAVSPQFAARHVQHMVGKAKLHPD